MTRNESTAERQYDEYLERVALRLKEARTIGKKMASLRHLAVETENHLCRFRLCEKRFKRAVRLGDKMAQTFERSLMYVLLYEACDHIFMVMQVLDPEGFLLESSLDGHGLTGESAAEIVLLVQNLDRKAREILELDRACQMHLDFQEPYDEKEGITYVTSPHWQEFTPGSISESFRDYFRSVRAGVHKRLEQRPKFWKNQTIRQHLHRKGYSALLQVIERLEAARL